MTEEAPDSAPSPYAAPRTDTGDRIVASLAAVAIVLSVVAVFLALRGPGPSRPLAVPASTLDTGTGADTAAAPARLIVLGELDPVSLPAAPPPERLALTLDAPIVSAAFGARVVLVSLRPEAAIVLADGRRVGPGAPLDEGYRLGRIARDGLTLERGEETLRVGYP